ncbi:hypothetical protein D7S86_25140 [Pararobbsia silviterrae]|uniref:Uncharacterized protein n=1 Tax=Pararobbsia silviterrae TaxID=1792498 RepID=A0A494X684_9BURK|nr:hypothetical protein D7S86_25140 [Pararobbsia silviterrae]
MENPTLTFGAPDGLHGALRWRSGYGTQGPVGRTWGDLSISIGSVDIWGRSGAHAAYGATDTMTWCWIDMLEFLRRAWPYLIEDDTCPIPLDRDDARAASLVGLRTRAFERWHAQRDAMTDAQIDDEDARLRDFMVVHDLGEALAGACAPPLILLRDGERMHVASSKQAWSLPFGSTMSTLAQLGDVIAARVRTLIDPRSIRLCAQWDARGTRTRAPSSQCSPSPPSQTSGK